MRLNLIEKWVTDIVSWISVSCTFYFLLFQINSSRVWEQLVINAESVTATGNGEEWRTRGRNVCFSDTSLKKHTTCSTQQVKYDKTVPVVNKWPLLKILTVYSLQARLLYNGWQVLIDPPRYLSSSLFYLTTNYHNNWLFKGKSRMLIETQIRADGTNYG